ncbi:ribosomal protein S9/S16-domain-containing protein [Armillaria fumosa]|nr:ribosomal protein S9/S16-domain-containing protein [Armillaria fumosa]
MDPDIRGRGKLAPESPSFYTGRAPYYDTMTSLQMALGQIRATLKTLQLLPLPPFARASLLPMPPLWKNLEEMSSEVGMKLNTTRYRRLLVVLNELHECLRIATTAGHTELADMIEQVVAMFERGESQKEEYMSRGKRTIAELDQFGRSYTLGRRKTSSARVWIIPRIASNVKPVDVPTTTILVNNLPLSQYFPKTVDRERVVYPLKVAGVLGKFNIFTIARGGGSTGQTGAIAHGIAKGLLAHDQELLTVLRKGESSRFAMHVLNSSCCPANLIKRDPRVVERKKTGLAKARKRYTWVKR